MTPLHVLLYLRLLELALMVGCGYWLMFHFAPSRLRTIRLILCHLFLTINVAAIGVALLWAKVTLW